MLSSDEKLSPEEFERLFAMDTNDYFAAAPSWIRRVEPIDVREGVDELLSQLKKATSKTRKLEQALSAQGVPIPQDIPYEVAKQKVLEINQRIMSPEMDEREYLKLCTELEKYTTAMMASDEYREELRQQEAKWEEQHRADNIEALKKLRRHMPVNIRFLSEDKLVSEHKLPRPIARKFKRTDILSLIRKSPHDLEKMHPGILEGLKTAGLTLTEQRALYEHLRIIGPKWLKAKDEMTKRKAQWYNNFKSKFKESVGAWHQHKEKYGSPAGHGKCDKIGNQCPFKAVAQVDYSGDFGFPTGDVYEEDDVTKAPKPYVKEEEEKPSRPANPMAAAVAAKAQQKPSFLGELSQKKKPTSTASSKISKPAPSKATPVTSVAGKTNALKQISKKSPEEEAAEKSVRQAESDKRTFEAKRAARESTLETHYKGKDDDVFDARGVCISLDDAMDDMETLLDEWVDCVVLAGDKKMSKEEIEEEIEDFKDGVEPILTPIENYIERIKWVSPSTVECELAEDLYRFCMVFFNFIQWRMTQLKAKDKDLMKLITDTQEKLKTLYQKNARKLKLFGITAERTRAIPSAKEMIDHKKRLLKKKDEKSTAAANPAPAPSAASSKAKDSLRSSSHHKPRDELKCSSHTKQTVPKYLERTPSCTTRTFEHQGKEHLKWLLVHQVNDAQKMIRRLETAMMNAGLSIPDDAISYQEAEAKMSEISQRMAEISFKHPDYFKLEQEMAKYSAALMASDEYRRETERREREWEASVRPANREALKALRRHMPVEVRKKSEAELSSKIPVAMAKKFKRTNVLQLIRRNPNDVAKFHFSNFEGVSLTGLTLTERRALYEHLNAIGPMWYKQRSNEQIERKWMWFQSMKGKFKDDLKKYEDHVKHYGPPGKHKCSFIGLQCPIKADAQMDYSGDYGFPEGPEYEAMEVVKEDLSYSQQRAKELREQREKDRRAGRRVL